MQSKKETSTQYIKSVTYHGKHYRYVYTAIYIQYIVLSIFDLILNMYI